MSAERRAARARVRAETREAVRELAAADWIASAATGGDPGELGTPPASWALWSAADPDGFREHVAGRARRALAWHEQRQAADAARAQAGADEQARARARRITLAALAAAALAGVAVLAWRRRRRRLAELEAARQARPAPPSPPPSSPGLWLPGR